MLLLLLLALLVEVQREELGRRERPPCVGVRQYGGTVARRERLVRSGRTVQGERRTLLVLIVDEQRLDYPIHSGLWWPGQTRAMDCEGRRKEEGSCKFVGKQERLWVVMRCRSWDGRHDSVACPANLVAVDR